MSQQAFRIRVTGTVQGVGFRPTVWQVAQAMGLAGTVRNDAAGVLIEIWCADPTDFLTRLREHLPPLAKVENITTSPFKGEAPGSFTIAESGGGEVATAIAADAATCPACLAEVLDPRERRHGYAFTNCTHCGPRLSIIRRLPYDRGHTTMAQFEMCPQCRVEYESPADRRFHAQPIACPVCGPRLWFEDSQGRVVEGDGIANAATAIEQGHIIAVKGLGGFHLACDAGQANAIALLRQRKQRLTKPFALMAPSLDLIRQHADADDVAASWLSSSAAPIVLLQRNPTSQLPRSLAPGQSHLGFMLPYTPLHHLLLRRLNRVIVLTSANLTDDPQVIGNDEARRELQDVADGFLMHDREIAQRVDDSVVKLSAVGPLVLRRARGLAPVPVALHESFADCPPVLAMGADLKGAIAIARHGTVTVSQHLGDLSTPRSRDAFDATTGLLTSLLQANPARVAVDIHPDFHSSVEGRRIAMAGDAVLVPVQHHHAHIASCMADNGLPRSASAVLGIALDGTGLGSDGSIWGGEFLKCSYDSFERLGHFAAVPLPGGDQAARQPWRNAYAHLNAALGWQAVQDDFGTLEIVKKLRAKPTAMLERAIAAKINSPDCSSAGRLFDACAALLGLCFDQQGYEGEAPALLESLALQAPAGGARYAVSIHDNCIGWQGLFAGLLSDVEAGIAAAVIARRIHETISQSCAELGTRLARSHGLSTIALSGGCFNNSLLLESLAGELKQAGFDVLIHKHMPCGDGGLAMGQCAVAMARTQSAMDWRNSKIFP